MSLTPEYADRLESLVYNQAETVMMALRDVTEAEHIDLSGVIPDDLSTLELGDGGDAA